MPSKMNADRHIYIYICQCGGGGVWPNMGIHPPHLKARSYGLRYVCTIDTACWPGTPQPNTCNDTCATCCGEGGGGEEEEEEEEEGGDVLTVL